MKYIKKNIYKILIALSLCLTLVLTLTFNTKTYAQEENNGYEILPDKIQSFNLWNPKTTEYGTINASTGVSGGGTATLHCDYTEILPSTHYVHNIIGGWSSGGGLAFYDSNYNYISGISSSNQYYNSFTTPNNAKYIRITVYIDNSSPQFVTDISTIMFNEGTTLLNFFPYGTFIGENEYDWNDGLLLENEELREQLNTIPRNYFTYIIGNNYFNNSSFTFNQRINNFNGALKVASTPLDTLNTYIEGKKLYLSQLFNYSYNNSLALDSNLNYVNVYNANGYSTSNYTYLSIYPHYNLPSNERSGMSLPLKYVNIIIDGSNYNGSIRLTTQIPNSHNPNTYQYIDVLKNSENKFIINYPDSDDYLISIDIQATYSNGAYNIPSTIISNVEQVSAVSDYQIGYDTAKSEYGQIIAQNTNIISNLNDVIEQNNQSIAILRQNINDLQISYENLLSGNNFANLFFTIAQTPFESFKQIWNVDFLGVNLSGFVTGILFIGLIIWLIKKVF